MGLGVGVGGCVGVGVGGCVGACMCVQVLTYVCVYGHICNKECPDIARKEQKVEDHLLVLALWKASIFIFFFITARWWTEWKLTNPSVTMGDVLTTPRYERTHTRMAGTMPLQLPTQS